MSIFVGFWKTVAWVAFAPLGGMGLLIAVGYAGPVGLVVYVLVLFSFLYKKSHKPKGDSGDSKISPDRQQKAIDRYVAEVKNE